MLQSFVVRPQIRRPANQDISPIGGLFFQPVDRMQSPNCQFRVRSVDQDRDLDLRRGDSANVDALVGKRLEGRCGNTGIATHADADDGDLSEPGFGLDRTKAN